MSVQQVSTEEVMKISAKGQVVIPASIRNKYGWKPGNLVVITDAQPGKLVLKKKLKVKALETNFEAVSKVQSLP